MLVKTDDGFEMEFLGDGVYLGYGKEAYGVWVEGEAVPEEMMRLRQELTATLEEYQNKFIFCLSGLDENHIRRAQCDAA